MTFVQSVFLLITLLGLSAPVAADDSFQLLDESLHFSSLSVHVVFQPLDERLAEQDKSIIEKIQNNENLDTIVDADALITSLLGERYDNYRDTKVLQRQFANTVSINLRRQYLESPLQTRRYELRGTALANIDLALGRQLPRYLATLNATNEDETVGILRELQNGLLVLSADQVEAFANNLGEILQTETHRLETKIANPQQRRDTLTALLNPALIIADTIKHRGPNALYDWLRDNQQAFKQANFRPARLYFFDAVAGVMVGFKHPDDVLAHIDQLLDPANIAWGRCSFGQMAANGLTTGNYACAMGPQCRASQIDIPGMDPGRFGPDLGKDKYADAPSPYGISRDTLQGNCVTSAAGGGSGGSGKGMGGGGLTPTGGGHGSFAGCLANAMYQQAIANDPARCQLDAAFRLRDLQRNQTVIVDAGPGGPVVRGIYGSGDGCGSNPRTQGNGSGSHDENKAHGEQVIRNTMDKFANRLADENNWRGQLIRELINKSANHPLTEHQFDQLAHAIHKYGRVCDTNCGSSREIYGNEACIAIKAGAGGEPCHVRINLKSDALLNSNGNCDDGCKDEAYRTMLHEAAAHGANDVGKTYNEANRKKDQNGNYVRKTQAEKDEDEAEEHHRYHKAKHEQDDAMIKGKDTAESIIDEIGKGQKQPNPMDRYEMCGPVAEAYRDMMQCSAGGVAGIDGDGNPIPTPDVESKPEQPGVGNTDGNVDPSQRQWLDSHYGNSALSRCTQQQGISVVGRDGKVYEIGGNNLQGSAQQCGALDCLPPSRARNVDGICRCVAPGRGAFMRNIMQHQQLMRTCAVMTVNCNTHPGSPCCGGHGGQPVIHVDPNTPVDPSHFDTTPLPSDGAAIDTNKDIPAIEGSVDRDIPDD